MRLRGTLGRLVVPVAVALTTAFAACAKETPPAPTGVIEREAFIATFVELRDAAMATPLKVLDDADRARILSEHGVTEEELLAFADAYGSDPGYMLRVWDEVKARMKPLAPAASTTLPDSLKR
jgi:hypothetical protein